MKSHFNLEAIKRFKSASDYQRKIKIFIGFGLIGTVLIGALAIWISIAGIRYANSLVQGQTIILNIDSLKSELPQLPVVAKVSCWGKARSLLSVNAWFEKPIAENLRYLRAICMEKSGPECKGKECKSNKQEPNLI